VVLRMLANVQQITIQPIIAATVAKGALVHTDEYGVYARLEGWGYQHKTVCHRRGEYARDEDGDGSCEVHVNTMEGFWSLLRARQHHGGVLVPAACTSTPWRGSGPCCARGCVRTGASRKTSYRTTSASSSSCTTRAAGAKLSSAPSSRASSPDVPVTTPEPDKSLPG
jgi:transposase